MIDVQSRSSGSNENMNMDMDIFPKCEMRELTKHSVLSLHYISNTF